MNDESAFVEPLFLVIFCQSRLLFSQHMVDDCAVLVIFLLFLGKNAVSTLSR